jgi:hypothetical protein
MTSDKEPMSEQTMKTTTRLIVFLASALTIWAQSPEPKDKPEGPHPKPPVHPVWTALDTDKDGELSAEEIEAAAEALAKLDANEDGKITRDEVKPPAPPEDQLAPKMKRPPPIVAALDGDQDGKLSAKEIRNADKSLASLDRNDDDELTGDEMFGPPPAQGEEGNDQAGPRGPRPQRPMPPQGGGPQGGGRGPRR